MHQHMLDLFWTAKSLLSMLVSTNKKSSESELLQLRTLAFFGFGSSNTAGTHAACEQANGCNIRELTCIYVFVRIQVA
jgi:hypothetical protein